MTWETLYGEHVLNAIRTDVRHPFDPNANGVALDLGDKTVFVFEDPGDGYRSSANEPLVVDAPLYSFMGDASLNLEYIRVPVLVRKWMAEESGFRDDEPDGVEFVDTRNGLVILTLGTDHSDSYYPSFTCEWQPQNIAENRK